MPLKLVPPRKGRSPNFTIRGTYLGLYVDKTAGTPRRSAAHSALKKLEAAIEDGSYGRPPTPAVPDFATAAAAYIEAGRPRRHIKRLISYFGDTPLDEIDQAAIDAAAAALCPNTAPSTKNGTVYTPVSAILHLAGVDIKLRRPKGAKGNQRTDYLNPDDAAAVITAADAIDAEFALLLRFLLYTGCRLGEALALTWEYVGDGAAYIVTSKNGDARTALLRTDLREALEAHRRSAGRVFRFHQGGHLKELLKRSTLAACGLPPPSRWQKGIKRRLPPYRLAFVRFHTFCHTWATWMRRYGGADLKGLVATGRWKDARSASRYTHVVASEEWQRVERLPKVG